MNKELLFLSPEWIQEAIKVIQSARSKDEKFKKLTSDYNLNLLYIVTDIPQELIKLYSSDKISLFIQLVKGVVNKFEIITDSPINNPDFTITSNYTVAKQIFLGKLSLTSAYINRKVKIEPMSLIYRRPRFTAKSMIVGNMILKLCKEIPTKYM